MKVKVNGSYFLYFNEFAMTSHLDAVASSFTMHGYFDPTNPAHKALYKPLTYPMVQFYHDDDTLFFTGKLVNIDFTSDSAPQLVSLSGYSLGGVLEDCTIPYEAYPLQSDNRSLKEIAQRLLGYFDLSLIVYDNVAAVCDKVYKKSVASPSGSVKEYLSKLAAQRNVIISHDVNGNIIMFRPDIQAKPIGWFDPTNITGRSTLKVNGQQMHSSVGSIRQPGKKDVTKPTNVNPFDVIDNNLVKAYRPYVHILTSGTETDTDDGAKNAFAAELKNIQVEFMLEHWENINPGDIIMFSNPDLYITQKARMMVLNTTKSESSTARTMAITAVLPETFTGDQPIDIFQ